MTQILIRRGTAATWTSSNPVLGLGEIGYETDTKKAKMGDGSTTWNSLGYWIPTLPTGTVVGTSDVQTLTGKTLNFASGNNNTIQNVPTSALSLSGAATFHTGPEYTTTSTSYVYLGSGDSLSATIGSSGLALVGISVISFNVSSGYNYAMTSFDLSGANTQTGFDAYRAGCVANPNLAKYQNVVLLTGLNAGATTFRMKHAVLSTGTGYFSSRNMWVIPL